MWTAVIPVSCSLTNQNQDKKPNQGSLEDLSQDQPDQAISEQINIQRRSPMIRNRKTGSMEVPDRSVWFCLYILRLAACCLDFMFFVNGRRQVLDLL